MAQTPKKPDTYMKSKLFHSFCIAVWTICLTSFPPSIWAKTRVKVTDSPNVEHTDARKSTLFDNSMIAQDSTPVQTHKSIQDTMSEIRSLEEQYLKLLDKGSNPTGLYLTGEYINNLSTDEYKYYRQIEWRLFNDGLIEDLRKEDKTALQNKLELLQLHRDMIDRVLAEKLYNLYTYENRVRHIHNKQRTEILKKLLLRREIALANGFTTSSDINELRQVKNTAERKMIFYAERKNNLLPLELASVLNQIEKIQLKKEPVLQKIAQKNSTALEIQNIYTERTKFYPAWSDNLAVDLIVGQGKRYYLEDIDTYIGVQIEIPISSDDRTDELIDLRQRIYLSQQKAISIRMDQKIDKLSFEFSLYQHKIESQIEMLKSLQANKESSEYEISNPIQHSKDDPERLWYNLQLKIIDTRFEVMHYRLKEYEIIIKMMSATGIKSIKEVFEPAL